MLEAVARALEVRTKRGIAGVATRPQLREVARRAGVSVLERPIGGGRIYGFYAAGTIVLARHLLPGTKRLVLAHELGHAVLGHRMGAYADVDGRPPRSLQEAQAHAFGFALLLGEPAPDLDGLTEQIMRGDRAGLPAPGLFAAVSALVRL